MSQPDLSLMTKKIQMTPDAFSASLREKGSVFWCEEEKFWVVTDYSLAEAVLKRPDFSADRSSYFASRMQHIHPSVVGDFFGVVQKMMVTSDAPQHTARRKLGSFGISDHVLESFRPAVERTVNDLIDKVVKKSRFDFVNEISQELPSIVLADLFSIEQEQRQNFYSWGNHMTQFFGAGSGCPMKHATDANESAAQLREFFTKLIAERRKSPQEDFISILVKNQESLNLDDSEVISQAIMMLVAGKITTTDQISNNMYSLLTRKNILEILRGNPDRLDAAIEEATRLDPAVNFVFRIVKQETQLGDVKLRQGEVVFISIHAVNRDPKVFNDPNAFLLTRSRNPHFSYGHGAHYCLGAKLARIQMNALFKQMLQRFPDLEMDREIVATRKHQSLAFSGFETLPIRTRLNLSVSSAATISIVG